MHSKSERRNGSSEFGGGCPVRVLTLFFSETCGVGVVDVPRIAHMRCTKLGNNRNIENLSKNKDLLFNLDLLMVYIKLLSFSPLLCFKFLFSFCRKNTFSL